MIPLIILAAVETAMIAYLIWICRQNATTARARRIECERCKTALKDQRDENEALRSQNMELRKDFRETCLTLHRTEELNRNYKRQIEAARTREQEEATDGADLA